VAGAVAGVLSRFRAEMLQIASPQRDDRSLSGSAGSGEISSGGRVFFFSSSAEMPPMTAPSPVRASIAQRKALLHERHTG